MLVMLINHFFVDKGVININFSFIKLSRNRNNSQLNFKASSETFQKRSKKFFINPPFVKLEIVFILEDINLI